MLDHDGTFSEYLIFSILTFPWVITVWLPLTIVYFWTGVHHARPYAVRSLRDCASLGIWLSGNTSNRLWKDFRPQRFLTASAQCLFRFENGFPNVYDCAIRNLQPLYLVSALLKWQTNVCEPRCLPARFFNFSSNVNQPLPSVHRFVKHAPQLFLPSTFQ